MDMKTRKRWALILLLVWLPLYTIIAWIFLGWVYDRWDRLPVWIEVPMYIVLALAWAVPFRPVFLGVGRGEE